MKNDLKVIDYIEEVQISDEVFTLLQDDYFTLIDKNWDDFLDAILQKMQSLDLRKQVETGVLVGMILYRLYMENNGGNF